MRDEKLEGCHFSHVGIKEGHCLAFVFFVLVLLKSVSEECRYISEVQTSSLSVTARSTSHGLSLRLRSGVMELKCARSF